MYAKAGDPMRMMASTSTTPPRSSPNSTRRQGDVAIVASAALVVYMALDFAHIAIQTPPRNVVRPDRGERNSVVVGVLTADEVAMNLLRLTLKILGQSFDQDLVLLFLCRH
jgi:hypothetical protein